MAGTATTVDANVATVGLVGPLANSPKVLGLFTQKPIDIKWFWLYNRYIATRSRLWNTSLTLWNT